MRTSTAAPFALATAFLAGSVGGCTGGNPSSQSSASVSTTSTMPSTTPSTTPSTMPSTTASPARGTVLWPAPPDPLDRIVAAGLKAETKEGLAFHVHAHLDVFVDGKPIIVPAGIGINISDPGVHQATSPDGSVGYGGIEECGTPCISPLHTHETDGILHTESETATGNTLGQFFTEWGVRLSATCVGEFCSPTQIAFYVNGKPYRQDPRALALTDHEEIAVVIGTPPPRVPDTADFSRV